MDQLFGDIIKYTPLFSFHTILDEDVGLIKYVYKNYNDKSVFDFSKVEHKSMRELISLIFYRQYINPLYLFMVDESKREFVDECYREFMEQKEADIIEEGVISEIPNLLNMYKNSSEVIPTIFYYNEYQKQALDRIPSLSNIEKLHFSQLDFDTYSQIYLKMFQELYNFPEFSHITIYFASTGVNLLVLDNLSEFEGILNKIRNKNRAAIFDIYNSKIIKKENDDEGN